MPLHFVFFFVLYSVFLGGLGEIDFNGATEPRFGGFVVKHPGKNPFSLEILEASLVVALSAARGLTGRLGMQGVKRQGRGQILLGGLFMRLGNPSGVNQS